MEVLYKTEDVAKMLYLPQSAVWRAIREGDMKAVKIGKRYLVTENQINEYIEKHTINN